MRTSNRTYLLVGWLVLLVRNSRSLHEQMSTKSTLKEDHASDIEERSEEELLEEETRNQQTLDCFVESDKKWS